MWLKNLKFLLLWMLLSTSLYSALTKSEVSMLYVAIFNRASEGEGNYYWQNKATMRQAATEMLYTDDAKAYFGSNLDSNQAFIEWIYKNTLNKTYADDSAGIDYWVNELNRGVSRGKVVADLVRAAIDPINAGRAQNQFLNRVTISNYMADHVYSVPADYKRSTSFSYGLPVDDSTNSVLAAKETINRKFGGITTLVSGSSLHGYVVEGSWKYYKVTLPSNASATVGLSGLSDDVDLYVKKGSLPNADDYDGVSDNSGTGQESLKIDSTQYTTLYIGIYGYTSGSYQLEVYIDPHITYPMEGESYALTHDGSKLIYGTRYGAIYALDLQTKASTLLVDTETKVSGLYFDRVNSLIYYSSTSTGGVYALSLDDYTQREIYNLNFPDGLDYFRGRLYIVSNDESGVLTVLNKEGVKLQTLYTGISDIVGITHSDKYLYILSEDGDIYQTNSDTGSSRKIFSNNGMFQKGNNYYGVEGITILNGKIYVANVNDEKIYYINIDLNQFE